MALATLIALLAAVIALIYFWIRKRFAFFEENGFPYEKPDFPLGNLKGVGREFHICYKIQDLYKKFKGKAPVFGIYFFATPDVVVTDLETVKNVLIRDFDYFHNRGVYNNVRDDPLSGNLFTIEDEAWKNMRAKLTPTFTSGKMKMMFETLVDIADNMTAQLEKEPNLEMIEIKEPLGKFTTDVIGNIAFGLEMNSIKDPDAEFRKMGKKIFDQDTNLQIKIFFMTTFKSIARRLRMKFFSEDVSKFFLRTIRETIEYREKNKIERNDVMDLLMKLKDEGNLSFYELAAQCFIYFFAGNSNQTQVIDEVLLSLLKVSRQAARR